MFCSEVCDTTVGCGSLEGVGFAVVWLMAQVKMARNSPSATTGHVLEVCSLHVLEEHVYVSSLALSSPGGLQ